MKDFSITRIPNNDLIGLLFYPVLTLSAYFIEVVKPEYIPNYYVVPSSGAVNANSSLAYSVIDVSKYEYVIIPVYSISNFLQSSGLNVNGLNEAFTERRVSSCSDGTISYGIFKVDATHKTAIINTSKNRMDLPIIGLMRRRTDNVNPRSPQRPELEPIEIRERTEAEPEPVPEIAEPEEDTPEEVEE